MRLLVEPPIRANDSYGNGEFLAPRANGRHHKGVDYSIPAGFDIVSPVPGQVTKIGYPYNDDLSFRYVQVTCRRGLKHRFFYVDPCVSVGTEVRAGDKLGKVVDLQQRYPADDKHARPITNHVHYEIIGHEGEFINPEKI